MTTDEPGTSTLKIPTKNPLPFFFFLYVCVKEICFGATFIFMHPVHFPFELTGTIPFKVTVKSKWTILVLWNIIIIIIFHSRVPS